MLLSLLAFAEERTIGALPPPLTLDVEFPGSVSNRTCYPSGLTTTLVAERNRPLVAVGMAIDAGSGDDPAGKQELAHLVEHLWFRSKDGPQSVWDTARLLGADVQATTSADDTTFVAVAGTRGLDRLLAVEARRLRDPLAGVDAATFLRERAVVAEEMYLHQTQHNWPIWGEIYAGLFPPGHPYARRWDSHVEDLTLEDARAFTAAWYTPAHATLVVRGDIDAARSETLIRRALTEALTGGAPIPCAPSVTTTTPPPPPPTTRKAQVLTTPAVERPTVVVAWTVPGDIAMDGIAQAAVQMIEVAAAERLGDDVRCWLEPADTAGVAACIMEPGTEVEGRIDAFRLAAPSALIDGLAWVSWSRTLSNVKRAWLVGALDRWEYRWSATGPQLAAYVRFVARTGEADYLGSVYQRNLTPSQATVREFIKDWLVRKRATTLILRPRDGETVPPAEAPLAWTATPSTPTVSDATGDASYLADLASLPDPAGWSRRTLGTGLHVVGIRRPSDPVAHAILVYPAGAIDAPAPGTDELAAYAASFDRSKLDGDISMAYAARQIGGYLTGGSDARAAWFGVSGLPDSLEAQLWLLRVRADTSRVRGGDHARWLRSLRKGARRDAAARREADLLLGSSLGARAAGAEDLAALGRVRTGDARRLLERALDPARATLVVIGHYDEENLRRSTDKWFADWKGRGGRGGGAQAAVALPEPPERTVQVVDDRTSSRYTVALACQIGSGATRPLAEVAETLVAEKLWDGVRADTGLAYSPTAWIEERPPIGALLRAEVTVPASATGFAVRALLSGLEELAVGPSEARLDRVRRTVARRAAAELANPWSLFDRVLDTPSEPGAGLATWASELAAVTSSGVAAAMQRCATHEVVTVSGHAEVVQAQLAAVGVASVEVGAD